MSSPADERLRLEARQRELAAERRESELAWTHELLARPTAALVQRAFRALGFREPVAYDEQHLPIRDLVRLLRGRTMEFWSACDAVADRASWRVYGLPSCNKGEPLQVAHVGHGTVPARFRDVRVGV